jgi:hypothetical protein
MKKRVFLFLETIVLLSVITLFLSYYSYKFEPLNTITGFTIYQDQPDSTTGMDSYIRQGSDANYGSQTTFRIGKTVSGIEYRGLIEFNLSSVPSTDTVVSAIIELYNEVSSGNNNITIRAYRLTSSWSEAEVGWNNRSLNNQWSSSGGDYGEEIASVVITNSSLNYYNLSIRNTVQAWINGTYDNYGIILIAGDAQNGDIREFSTSESTNSLTRPKIIIDHTENAAPIINNITIDSLISDPKKIGDEVTFNVNWTDLELDPSALFVCNTNQTNISGCLDITYCSTSLSQDNPVSCIYTIVSGDNRTNKVYISMCDATNCSAPNQGYFYMNHNPYVLLIQPNGGEIINQSRDGNYLIKFNVTDSDSDKLIANLYLGETQNSTDLLIASNLNLTLYCTDIDNNTKTKNNCSYSWNSSEYYGDYYMNIIVNDSYGLSADSSNNYFGVYGMEDFTAPNISAEWIGITQLTSGKETQIYANVSDLHLNSVWVAFNYTSTNLTMRNLINITYNATYIAVSPGTYRFKVYARDIVGNINDSMPWIEFNITKPIAGTQNVIGPSISLPYNTIRIEGELNSTNLLKNVYAYLNIPNGFNFMNNYPQNNYLGNFSENETKKAIWFLSTPLSEGTYTINITYADGYYNFWNSTSLNITVTSAIGGYILTIEGYPEVETTENYFVTADFKQNSNYISPDSIYIYIYDATGSVVLGPVLMTEKNSGKYNYSYTIGSSVTEGLWETRVNATKSGISYYSNQFFNVVGGPFDIRDIEIINSEISNLNISVVTENTGGAIKDLTLVWNLTRIDTGVLLDSGSDTFAVNPYSEKLWSINPTTDYIGPVRITFLGYYSGTEKAGAYRIFSTTGNNTIPPSSSSSSSGGGGGFTLPPIIKKNPKIKLENYENILYLPVGIKKTIVLNVSNIGNTLINNLTVSIEDYQDYNVSPIRIEKLNERESVEFKISFFIKEKILDLDTNYIISSSETSLKEPVKIITLDFKEYISKELESINNRIKIIKKELDLVDSKELNEELTNCQDIAKKVEIYNEIDKFDSAEENLAKTKDCLDILEINIKDANIPRINISFPIIITWIFMFIITIILIVILYILYKKSNLIDLIKVTYKDSYIKPVKPEETYDPRRFDDKLKDIKKRLNA